MSGLFLAVFLVSWVLVWLSQFPAGSHGFPETTSYSKPDFYARKMSALFATMDANSDGYLSPKDFDLIARRTVYFAQLSRYDANILIYKKMPKMWNALHYDKAGIGRPASMDEMIASMKERRLSTEFNTSITKFAEQRFDIMDIDSDGTVSPTEHAIALKSLGIVGDSGKKTFATFDINGDGFIDRVEYLTSAKNFFNTLDENLSQ